MSLDGVTGVVAPGDERPFTYIVLGDPSHVTGLAAPYDEAETDDVMHLEQLDAAGDPFTLWRAHANSDLMTGRHFEKRNFQTP